MEENKTRKTILFIIAIIFLSLILTSKSPLGICCCSVAFIYCLISAITLK